MKTKIKKLFALAVAAVGFGIAVEARAAGTGSIWAIVPCDQYGTAVEPYATQDEPITTKRQLYFKICLKNEFAEQDNMGKVTYLPWKREANQNTPRVGIFAGGSLKWATLLDEKDQPTTTEESPFTQLVFAYTVQPGDFALPIRIATIADPDKANIDPNDAVPEGYATSSANQYYVDSRNNPYVNDNGDNPKWQFVTGISESDEVDGVLTAGELWFEPALNLGFSLDPDYVGQPGNTGDFKTKCGFYVQTVKFDDSTMADDTYWRTVPADSTKVKGGKVQISVIGEGMVPDSAKRFYIWSDNKEAVVVTGPNVEELTVDESNGMKRQVAALDVQSENTAFEIKGVSQDKEANLILSAWPRYNYDEDVSPTIIKDYISVKVRCTEAEPPKLAVSSDATIYATSDRFKSTAAAIRIETDNQAPVANDITVRLIPTVKGNTEANWRDYVFFGEDPTCATLPEGGLVGSSATIDYLEFTIKAGQWQSNEAYYIYALGTVGNGTVIVLTPDTDDTAFDDKELASEVAIKASSSAALVNEDATPTKGIDFELEVHVQDTYIDTEWGVAQGGYSLTFYYDNTTVNKEQPSNKKEFTGLYLTADGILTLEPNGTKLPSVNFNSDQYKTSSFVVTSPVSRQKAPEVSVTWANGISKLDATAEIPDSAVKTEGSADIPVTFTIPACDRDLYAFLVSKNDSDDITANKFPETDTFVVCEDTNSANTKGVKISAGYTTASATLTVYDNFSGNFSVVLCTSEQWDENEIYSSYPATDLNPTPLQIANASPRIRGDVLMYRASVVDAVGDPDKKVSEYEESIASVPNGTKRAFRIYVNDTPNDLNDGFITRWVLKNPNGKVKEDKVFKGINPNEESAQSYYVMRDPFDASGNWTLTVQAIDKDDWKAYEAAANLQGWTTEEQIWRYIDDQGLVPLTATRTVTLNVIAKPKVTIQPSTYSIYENASSASLTVSLDYWDESSTELEELEVKVEIWPLDDTTDGGLKLSTENEPEKDGNKDVYTLKFKKNSLSHVIRYDAKTIDGTATTSESGSNNGFQARAYVSSQDILVSSEMRADEFYEAFESLSEPLKVINAKPNISSMGESNSQGLSNTNVIQITGGKIPPIKWSVKDCTADLTRTGEGDEAKGGIHVVITSTATLLNDESELDFYATTGKTSGSFTPNFGSYQGKATVTFTFTDKEGADYDGEVEWVSLPYDIPPAKYLILAANGPSRGNTTIQLSQWYAAATGRGAGHAYVYGTGVSFWNAINFNIQWNCGSNTRVTAYAAGYKVGDWDDGNLGDFDIGLSSKGNRSINDKEDAYQKPTEENPVGTAYSYATFDKSLDSFFYGWIYANPKSSGGEADGESADYIISAAPEVGENIVQGTLSLPTARTEDGTGYLDTYVEAVFSRELYAADNLGDINFDGIPDYFALTKKYGSGAKPTPLSEIDNDAGELGDISDSNEDEDFYPTAGQLGQGGGFIPNAVSGWATSGQPFTAELEIRGYHSGLNYGMFQAGAKIGDTDGWISDLDLSAGEKIALLRAAQASTVHTKWPGAAAEAQALIDNYEEFTGGEVAAATTVSVANWLLSSAEKGTGAYETFELQQSLAKAFIDATWSTAANGAWGFTVENRTDPKMSDSDNDGMDDGYEYYFWYAATVGFENDKQEQLSTITGWKFNIDDIEKPIEISSEDIASIFNPNVASDWTSRDTDADGLTDLEEMLIGTSPINWDTDGDGLSDFYEVMSGISPLDSKVGASFNGDGDFMAIANMPGTYVLYKTEDEDRFYAFKSPLEKDEDEQWVGEGFLVAKFNGQDENGNNNYTPCTLNVTTNLATKISLPEEPEAVGYTSNIKLYHHQVYCYFGFDPRTGWFAGSNGLSLTSRWKVGAELIEGGTPQNTSEFTARNEFLLMKFRKLTGMNYREPKDGSVANYLTLNCTNPNQPFAEISWGDDTVTYSQEYHGADSDGDKVPDGWELYVGVDPLIAYTVGKQDPDHDTLYWDDGKYRDAFGGTDGEARAAIGGNVAYSDGLDLATEYAGSDSSGVYAGCDTVYSNCPSEEGSSISGWINKLYPTDPRNIDTDGDGIKDGEERSDWQTAFTFGRWGQNGHANTTIQVRHMAIYGNPTDGGAICTKGGGFNPCTIDTDGDALPDLWERQYAGVLFKGLEPYDEGSQDRALQVVTAPGSTSEDVYDDFRAAALAYYMGGETNEIADALHVLMGMDGTVQDAANLPDVTYVDFDWDGDGLQNWQEYMVQAMRHFRYDDSRTPLLGRDIARFDEVEGMVAGDWYGSNEPSKGFLRVSYTTPFTEAELDKLVDLGIYSNFVEFVRENPNYLADLGYFAPPPRAWDHAAVDLGFSYMLPPNAYKDIASDTDAMVQATDEEGNPLWVLKKGANDVVTDAFVGKITISDSGVPYYIIDENKKVKVEPAMIENPVKFTHQISIQTGTKYIGTDPRCWDTDQDGMDDYYELFHGLNPILGSVGTVDYDGNATSDSGRDIIALSGLGVTAWQNAWIGWDNEEMPQFDPIRFPWLAGAAEADPDGDLLRNYEESLLADITAPNSSHTDPTPLWMTDATVPSETIEIVKEIPGEPLMDGDDMIYVWSDEEGDFVQAYGPSSTVTRETNIVLYKSPSYTALYYPNEFALERGIVWRFNSTSKYLCSFEQNEGYDTDNDWRNDSGEIKALYRKNSDPLDFSDPARRQSVWFGGNDKPGVAISYMPAQRNTHGTDFFRQFTVEAWIKPGEPEGGEDQYIVSRASNYGPWDLDSWKEIIADSHSLVRLNFAIGIDASGHVFAETQNSTDLSSRVTGNKAQPNEWIHIAATYDGKTLMLYRNGLPEVQADTTLIPATGVDIIEQDPQFTTGFPYSDYRSAPSITILGGRAIGPGAFGHKLAAQVDSWSQVATNFYQGSIAEVRTWDGARSVEQIVDNYKKRFSVEDLKDLRSAIFEKYADGATRNAGTLPPELIQYYNFMTLPGAVESGDVRLEPGNFKHDVLAEAKNPNTGDSIDELLAIGWWSGVVTNEVIGSKVYTSKNVVPWMENMVGHLPSLCGNTPDSFYWTEHFAWFTPAAFQGLLSFDLRNSLNPYNVVEESGADLNFARKYYVLKRIDSSNEWFYKQFMHEQEYGLSGISDLIPLGSTYAKRNTDSWDKQGAETAWSDTCVDEDGDELPDWWEVAKYGDIAEVDAQSEVDYSGMKVSAYEAYLRDLAKGWLPGAEGGNVAYVNREDFNNDGLPDWWSDMYGVKGGANADDDNDGLSNYTEFLLSEVFTLGVNFSPVNAYSVNNYNTDYFYRIGQLYAGEIFTDHDFLEDIWEDKQDVGYTGRYEWDFLSDPDEDGWTNFAERRYSQFIARIFAPYISHLMGDEEMKDMPIPTMKMKLRYNGNQPLKGGVNYDNVSVPGTADDNQQNNAVANLIIQTFTRNNIVVPDATFILQPGAVLGRRLYLGGWVDYTIRGYLAPGYIQIGDLSLMAMEVASKAVYTWRVLGVVVRGSFSEYLRDVRTYGSDNVEMIENTAAWSEVQDFYITQSSDSLIGDMILGGKKVGRVHMQTGEFELYMSELEGATTVDNPDSAINLDTSVFMFNYKVKLPLIHENLLQVYLGEANIGYVKEGKNTVVAFYDLDNDGKYTMGEPMGSTIIDVGWHQGDAEIELTDTTPVITRCDLMKVVSVSDREARYGTQSGDAADSSNSTLSGGKVERVRVIRTKINGYDLAGTSLTRVVLDKEIDLDQRTYFYEGDILENGEFDIDWNHFNEIKNFNSKIDPQEIQYSIVIGNGDINLGSTNGFFDIRTVRHYEAKELRTKPVEQAPGGQSAAVFGSRPVFKWTMKFTDSTTGNVYDNNNYTAFKVQVLDGDTLVYDSGMRTAPARDLNGVYTFVPDVYAGDLLQPDKNYKWRVSMYNSKFQSDYFSDGGSTFRMNTISNSLEYGSIRVAARYFGPDKVLNEGTVRIEAFDTPDFTGTPVARTYVKENTDVANAGAAHTANATLIGLPKGTYYVRGYIDMNKTQNEEDATKYSFKKDAWESWGYVSTRNGSTEEMFAPTAIVIGDNFGEGEVFDLYIEDFDMNGNSLPDAWEFATKGKLDKGTERIDDTLNCGIAINNEIAENLSNLEETSTVAGLSAYAFSVVKNAGVAALILDANTSNYSSYSAAAAAAANGLTSATTLKTLKISAIDIDEEGKVKVTAESTGETTTYGVAPVAKRMYNTRSATPVEETVVKRGKLYYTYDLEGEWTASIDVDINVNTDGSLTVTPFDIPVEITDGHDKTFFKIVMEEE